ncbi:hypothetical protein KOW79_004690 [Hemibagrus wyckioides]|uniref:Thrombospondin-type laminin G domain and EAR repeat-containing protein n=1 Tax=Hemibagrus wyckioides TaxID=337641 RepID=A0A9D3NY83_9TELE|nr:hypothetical protein KOW79_004690 [Hemibagrus wyckioides]
MLLKLVITFCCFISSWSSTWRPCTDLLPLDLLHRVLPAVGSHQTHVRMVQSQGSRGLKLSGPPQALSFPSSQIFTNCNFFPAEFSIVVTVKIPKLNPNKDEYVFTLLDEDSDKMLVGLRLSHDKVHFLWRIGDRTERVTFRQVNMADGHWHTMVLALSGHYAVLTLDCGIPVELQLEKPFPEQLYTGGSTFFIGSRRRWSGQFSGLIRQLVLMPGSDASSRLCPSSDPTLSVLSVPQVLLHLPVKPSSNLPLYPYEAELRVTQYLPPVCISAVAGQLWFSIEKRSLFLCNGTTWVTMMQNREKLDYVEDHQDIFTISETFDIEVFHLPSLGLFIATANRDSSYGSAIYRWTNGRFERFQDINTYDAQAWKFFTVGKKRFLVVANSRRIDGNKCELSVIYKWRVKKQRFVEYQKIQTHSARDWEAFRIHDDNFLAVANHREGEMNHNIDSVIYKWNRQTRKFEVNQTILTSGAYDWEFFTIGPYHFLVVANTFNGKSTDISSTIYIWMGGKFQPFQYITTFGAIDWEMFQIDNRFFLAVANSQKLSDSSTVLYNINSTIYELNTTSQSFMKFQDIATSSALDWEFFTVGDDKFLVVANSYDGASYSINSVIYRSSVCGSGSVLQPSVSVCSLSPVAQCAQAQAPGPCGAWLRPCSERLQVRVCVRLPARGPVFVGVFVPCAAQVPQFVAQAYVALCAVCVMCPGGPGLVAAPGLWLSCAPVPRSSACVPQAQAQCSGVRAGSGLCKPVCACLRSFMFGPRPLLAQPVSGAKGSGSGSVFMCKAQCLKVFVNRACSSAHALQAQASCPGSGQKAPVGLFAQAHASLCAQCLCKVYSGLLWLHVPAGSSPPSVCACAHAASSAAQCLCGPVAQVQCRGGRVMKDSFLYTD